MLAPQVRIDDTLSWGLGWGLLDTAGGVCFWHWGDLGDHQSFAIGSRAGRYGLVVMTNGERGLAVCEARASAALGREHARPLETVRRLE